MQKLLFVLSQTPDSPLAIEALDAVMTAVLFEQNPYLIFVGEGVQQLKQADLASKVNQLVELGLKHIYIKTPVRLSDQKHVSDIKDLFRTLSTKETSALLHQADKILSF